MIRSRRVFVKGLRLDAAIGIYDHEHDRTQPLIVDAVMDLSLHDIHGLKDTLNYEQVGQLAHAQIAKGHIKLVETFAEALAADLLALPHVTRAEVTVSKPEALSDADTAGCTVIYER